MFNIHVALSSFLIGGYMIDPESIEVRKKRVRGCKTTVCYADTLI